MAKKQTMNFFEANIEKFIIAIAVLFLGWVVYSNILNAPGVNVGSETVSGVDAANEAKERARSVVQNMSRTAPVDELENYKPVGDLLALVEPLQIQEIALVPPDITRQIKEQDVRNYSVPQLPELTNVKVELTKSMAYVPTDTPQANPAAAVGGDPRMQNFGAVNTELKDVRFVSVEATVNLEDLYDEFTRAFTGPQVNKPMTELYTPIIAAVDLLRSEMKEDGSWTEPISVPRAQIDPMRNTLQATDFRVISKARHSVAMRDNSSDQVQLMLLQPQAYDLIEGPWKNPSSTDEDEDVRRGAAARDPRAMADPRAGGIRDPRAGGGVTATSELKDDDLKFWAHDDTIVPGKIYKYSIRLGFFNPCYETNWLVDAQADLKYQPILWTKSASPRDNIVQVPPVTLFVPRAIADSENARVEVYKYQNGQWFKRPFTVSPGTQIGSVVTLPAIDPTKIDTTQTAGRQGLQGEQESALTDLDVDFNTNLTVVEIKPPAAKTFEVNGQTISDISGEIVYRDADGTIKTIDSNNAFWDENYRQMLNDVNRAYTADERKRRDLARNRR